MKQVSTAQPDGYFSLSSHVHKSHRRLRAPIGVSTSHQSPPPPPHEGLVTDLWRPDRAISPRSIIS